MLNDQSYAEKHLRALHRELDRLRQRQRNPPVHELHPPIQRGWKRHFVMRQTTRERPDAALLETILKRLSTVRYFWRPDFKHTRRQGGRRGVVEIEQQLLAISLHRWIDEKILAEWRKYFRVDLVPEIIVHDVYSEGIRFKRWSNPFFRAARRGFTWAYVFRFPSLFELRVEKHWLTHCTEIEPEVEERVAEIQQWMEHHHGNVRFDRLHGRSQRRWRRIDDRQKGHAEQARHEMRAHLGTTEREAAENIPSKFTALGGAAGGMSSAASSRVKFRETYQTLFAAVRPGILRSNKTRPPRHASLTGYRHSGQGSQALASRGGPSELVPVEHFRADRMFRRQSADTVCQSRVQANGPGRLRPAFSAKTNPDARVMAVR